MRSIPKCQFPQNGPCKPPSFYLIKAFGRTINSKLSLFCYLAVLARFHQSSRSLESTKHIVSSHLLILNFHGILLPASLTFELLFFVPCFQLLSLWAWWPSRQSVSQHSQVNQLLVAKLRQKKQLSRASLPSCKRWPM
jgi:hypothetical protein